MAIVRDRAIVLRRFPFSESSLVARVLTREHGRVHLFARGAHRPRSRYFALLDHFDELELEWSASERRELCELRAGTLALRRRGLTRSLERYRAGNSMLELADLGSRQGEPDRSLFELLSRSLARLDGGAWPADRALVVFELGFLQNHGLAPALERCASCGGEAPPAAPRAGSAAPRVAFSAGAGGRLCTRCAATARAGGRRVGTLPEDVLTAAAGHLRAARPDGPAPPDAAPELLARVRDFVERFLEVHLEARPRSLQTFLSVQNRNAPTETR